MAGRVGVVLLSMGEPDSLGEVRPYLRRLLADRDLVRLKHPALQPFFAWAVSGLHAARLRRSLAAMGGGSPLNRITGLQARSLEESLRGAGDFRVYAALRYCRPSAAEAVRRMQADRVERAVALPLYPQFFRGSTGSSLNDLHRSLQEADVAIPVQDIRAWPEHEGYVAALAGQVERALAGVPGGRAHLLFTAHGVPSSAVEAGDPYRADVERTVTAVRRRFPSLPHCLAFQSRSGRGRWLEPDAAEEVARLGREGTPAVVAVPVSFVSDCSETCHDIDIVLRQAALRVGVRTFLRAPAFNDAPDFITALKDLVLAAAAAHG